MTLAKSIGASAETLEYFFHHVFLPSKLPKGDDTSAIKESYLITFVRDSLSGFLLETDLEHHVVIKTAISMMQNMMNARSTDGYLEELKVEKVLKELHSPRMLLCKYSISHLATTDITSFLSQ